MRGMRCPSVKACFVIAIPSDAAPTETEVLVDVASDAVETNVDAWIAAERTAYTEKYGKLNPGLYERLQQIDDQERLPVAIWVARTEQDKPVEELLAAALDALNTQGIPWAVTGEEQARVIHERYVELLNAEVARRVAPLAAELRTQGHVATEFTGMTDGLWSALVMAEQPLVVVANATCTSCSGDNVYAYNGFAR
jgi:hypothetical protein